MEQKKSGKSSSHRGVIGELSQPLGPDRKLQGVADFVMGQTTYIPSTYPGGPRPGQDLARQLRLSHKVLLVKQASKLRCQIGHEKLGEISLLLRILYCTTVLVQ